VSDHRLRTRRWEEDTSLHHRHPKATIVLALPKVAMVNKGTRRKDTTTHRSTRTTINTERSQDKNTKITGCHNTHHLKTIDPNITHRLIKAMPLNSISNLRTIDLSIMQPLHRAITAKALQPIGLSSTHRPNKDINSKATLHRINRTFLI
jgi:hypothetical protein